MVRISQAILVGVLGICIAAILGFVGGWRLSFQMREVGNQGFAPTVQETRSESTGQQASTETTNTSSSQSPATDMQALAEDTPTDIGTKFRVFWDVWGLVEREFYHTEPLDKQQMVYGAIRGMLASLEDNYTGFEEPRDAERSRESLRGSFEGIGALLRMREGELVIIRPLRKSPAIKAGVQSDDVIVKIDGEEVAELTEGMEEIEAMDTAVDKIRGPKGSTVVLTIRRPPEDTILDIAIERDNVPLISVNSQMIGNIAHVQITNFSDSTPDEFAEELRQVLAENPAGMVLDLRNNPGGIVDSSLTILGHFYEGTALYEDNSLGTSRELKTITDDIADDVRIPKDLPIVVLINEHSASATEIVAGALSEQREEQTTLMGKTSYGKGSVQNVHKLRDNSSVRITIAHWFTPERQEIQGVGIPPDFVVEYAQDEAYAMPCIGDMVPPDGMDQCNDSQLTWAVRYLTDGETPPTPTPEPTQEQD